MPKQHLTEQFLRSLKPPESRTEYYDQHIIKDGQLKRKGVKGMFVRHTKAGSIYFYYRYYFDGKRKSYKIGSYPNIGLSKARDKARDLSGQVNHGTDPQAEKNKRKHKPKVKKFEALAAEFEADYLPEKKESTRKEYKRVIDTELLPKLKSIPVPEITSHHVRNIFKAKKKDGSPTMANRIRAVTSSIFSYAMREGLTKENPVTATARYKEGENTRERFYSEAQIKALWNAFQQEVEPIQSVFKMLLLTAQRKTETMRMKWDDVEGNVWNIPAENAKNKQSHDVPLSDMALQIIEAMRPITGESAYVFESPRKDGAPLGWIKQTVDRIRERSRVKDFRIHDLRRTAATHMAKLETDPMIIGKVLNHKGLAKENTITAIYNQHDYMKKKYTALNRWSNRLQDILAESE